MKDSKDSDFSLISTENLSQKVPSSSWGPGLDNLDQKDLNLPHLNPTLPIFVNSN